MGNSYSHFSQYEREAIETELRVGLSQAEIAKRICRSRSSVCREIRRGSKSGRYLAQVAHKTALVKSHKPRRSAILNDSQAWNYVLELLREKLSPAQISGRLKLEHPDRPEFHMCAETIYRHIYIMPRGELRTQVLEFLRQGRKKRRPRARGEDRRGQITNMTLIADRPEEAEGREVPGHWEGDLILGAKHGSAIGTLVERKSRLVLLVKLPGADAASALKAFTRAFDRVPEGFKESLTYDRGKEMAKHEKLTETTGVKVFFADPHSPWQRGSNENMNGLLRQYFPKGTDLSAISWQELRKVERSLNSRPRAMHDFYTPQEVWKSILTNQPVALGL